MISTIFFDMDGVLADFTRGAMKVHQVHIPMTEVSWNWMSKVGFSGEHCDRFWDPLRNAEFWANLDPHSDGMALFSEVSRHAAEHKIGIMSNAGVKNSAPGKDLWLDKHLPGYRERAHYAIAKYLAAAPCKLLVDDSDKNIDMTRYEFFDNLSTIHRSDLRMQIICFIATRY